MRLVVISHKPCWTSRTAPLGYATDGGFAKQMNALSELFDHTTVCVPVSSQPSTELTAVESVFDADRLSIHPLPELAGSGLSRRLRLPFWLIRVAVGLLRQTLRADAVHAPIPGDVGSIGIVLAELTRKPLFVRYCGNWEVERTTAERLWHTYMRRSAGGKRVMLATGGAAGSPEPDAPSLRWIFSASLWERELPNNRPTPGTDPESPGGSRPPLSAELRLITVGRQEPYKGTGKVIEALPILIETYPRIMFDVLGDGSGIDEFRRLAEELGVDGHVTFHGATVHRQVVDKLGESHVFVFPTKSEGFPKVVAEALACGTPVITNPVSVLASLITDEVGMLMADDDPATIAKAVLSVCDADYETRSSNAVALGRRFTLDRWRDELGEMLADAWGPLAQRAV